MAEDKDRMAELFGALIDQRAVLDETPGLPGPSAGRIAAYARRTDAVADFALEQRLRSDPGAWKIYQAALGARAFGISELAVAAGSGAIASRVVGGSRVELIEDGDAVFLIIRLGEAAMVPGRIEVRGPDGTGTRIALGTPIRGILQVKLDEANPDLKLIRTLLGRPDSAVYLLP